MADRDAKDFAIEFGGYMATSADRLMAYLSTPGAVDATQATDLLDDLRSSVYEFRKRAAKASPAAGRGTE